MTLRKASVDQTFVVESGRRETKPPSWAPAGHSDFIVGLVGWLSGDEQAAVDGPNAIRFHQLSI